MTAGPSGTSGGGDGWGSVGAADGVDAEDDRMAPTSPGHGAAARRPAVVVAAVAVGVAAGLAVGMLLAGSLLRPAVPGERSVDAGFARDMQVHHAQAVEMSVLVRERSTDPAVRQLALDVLLTQQQQAGQMFGWLEQWGLRQASSGPPMAWMAEDHGHTPDDGSGDTVMPGYVDREQMGRLAQADGQDADRLYLALMIPHHEGALEMAEAAVDRAQQPAVRALAEKVIQSQTSEIRVLEDMLAERGGAPE